MSESIAVVSKPGIHALLLTDCSNILAGISQGNPRTKERTTRLVRSHLRDIRKFLTIAYCSAPMNLSDIGTKFQGDIAIFRQFLQTGSFPIGFLSCAECKAVFRAPHAYQYLEKYEK